MNVNSTWAFKRLVFWHIFASLLLLSLFSPYGLWNQIDIGVFRFLNAPLANHPNARLFWAAANHRLADWLEDLCLLGLCIAAVFKAPKDKRRKRSAQLIFCALLTAMTILLINRVLCRDLLRLRRQSPTLILDAPVFLSDYISSFSVKVESSKSFPGDHATTALLFASAYAYFVRGRLGLCALLYAGLLCLPRLVVGAHWFSDVIVGSGTIAILSLAWALTTPLAAKSIRRIDHVLSLFARKKELSSS